jgi:hypothetical protein
MMLLLLMMICSTKYDVFRTVHILFKVLLNTAFRKLHLFPSTDVRKLERAASG